MLREPTNPFAAANDFMTMRDSVGTQPLAGKLFVPPEVIRLPAAMIGGGGGAPRGHQDGAPQGAVNAGGDWGKVYGTIQSEFGGLKVTSGYRDPEHNRRVGGVPNSNHTKKNDRGEPGAMDFVGSEEDMRRGAERARALGATEVLVHNVGSGNHLHVGFKS